LTLADLPASQNCHRSVVTASSGGLKEGKCEALSFARISGAAALSGGADARSGGDVMMTARLS